MDLKALLDKYLNDQCTAAEASLLFNEIQKPENELLIRNFISNELNGDPIAIDRLFANEKAIETVRKTLLVAVKDSSKENNRYSNFNTRFIKIFLSAAAIFILIASATVYLIYRSELIKGKTNSEDLKELVTNIGEKKRIQLYDGTTIWLCPSSKLKYRDQLIGKFREVSLDGEAFFQVAKDKSHPFIIHSGNMRTEVVGTSFDITSYSNLKIFSVSVVTGIVKVSSNQPQSALTKNVVLKPGQKVFFNRRDLELTVSSSKVQAVLNRKSGILSYNGTPIQEVITDLRRYYDASIKLGDNTSSCLCFGDFDTSQPLSVILKQISVSINGNAVEANGGFIINGGCKEP
ncbi:MULTISPECIES: FecR family protein [Mucilaginibacter]|uniref:FecR family protein n=1 Tax=Mucilaginibacter TaxID=423349 RepID=UPI001FB7FBD8|nr:MULTISPECIES: FecR family protein [Mucilaginibacter]